MSAADQSERAALRGAPEARPEVDVFISHAGTADADFVDLLVRELVARRMSVLVHDVAESTNAHGETLHSTRSATVSVAVLSVEYFQCSLSAVDLKPFLVRALHRFVPVFYKVRPNDSTEKLNAEQATLLDAVSKFAGVVHDLLDDEAVSVLRLADLIQRLLAPGNQRTSWLVSTVGSLFLEHGSVNSQKGRVCTHGRNRERWRRK